MKILVFADSHSSLNYMRRCIDVLKPDAVIHLGDHYDDAQAVAEEYPNIRFHIVPGNCDGNRAPLNAPQILCYSIDGVRLYMTHGHLHDIKRIGISHLLYDARKASAQVVLYGHTHRAQCYQEEDGLWVMNPGTCGYYGGSAGILEIRDGKISACRLLQQADLEVSG